MSSLSFELSGILKNGGSLAEKIACAQNIEDEITRIDSIIYEQLLKMRDTINNVLEKFEESKPRELERMEGERIEEARVSAASVSDVLTENHRIEVDVASRATVHKKRRRRAKSPRPSVADDPVMIDKRSDGVGFLVLNPTFQSDWTKPIPIRESARHLTMEEVERDDYFLRKCAEAKKKGTNLVFHRTKLRQVLLGKIHPVLPNGLRIAIPPPLGIRQCEWDCVLGRRL